MVTLQLRQLSVPPGHRVMFHNVSWQEFEAILEELGDHRAARLAYSQGTLQIRMPLPKHEKAKVIVSMLVSLLLVLYHPDVAVIKKLESSLAIQTGIIPLSDEIRCDLPICDNLTKNNTKS